MNRPLHVGLFVISSMTAALLGGCGSDVDPEERDEASGAAAEEGSRGSADAGAPRDAARGDDGRRPELDAGGPRAGGGAAVREAGVGRGRGEDAAPRPPTATSDAGQPSASNQPDSATADAAGRAPSSCAEPDKEPAATAISGIGRGNKPVGKFATVVERDPGIADQTIFRPATLGEIAHPILTWGNGGCSKSNGGFTEFLLQFAAEGIVVIADGAPSGMSGSSPDDGSQLIKAIDWAEKENQRPCSKYYGKLDLTKVAVAGMSCGGLMAINASRDERVAVSMPMNSGLFQRNQALYSALHAPMAIINGGPDDIAYNNGRADFQAISTIPVLLANIPVGHGGTYQQDNGGAMGTLALAWIRWHLLDDQGAMGKGMFIGDACGLCSSEWMLEWKNKPQ